MCLRKKRKEKKRKEKKEKRKKGKKKTDEGKNTHTAVTSFYNKKGLTVFKQHRKGMLETYRQ